MNKEAMATKLSDKHGLTKKQAKEVFDGVFDIIKDELVDGEKVAIPGFGVFTVKDRKERKGRNPQTGEEMTIQASKTVGFKPYDSLKSEL